MYISISGENKKAGKAKIGEGLAIYLVLKFCMESGDLISLCLFVSAVALEQHQKAVDYCLGPGC